MTDLLLSQIKLGDESQFGTDEYVVNLGPQHPATHGVLRLIVKLDGETVKETLPVLGYLHRSIEKICENRTYPQCITYTDRVDYVSAMSVNLGFALATEKLMGIEAPQRAQWLRMIMVELQRLASHLLWMGAFAGDIGALTPFLYGLRERERIIDLFEMTCGQRLTYNYIRIGGVMIDILPEFVLKCIAFLDYFDPKIDEYEGLLTYNPIFLERSKGVGIITPEVGINNGVCGPSLRGSGVVCDVRKQQPYLYYDQLQFKECLENGGDCWSRYKVRMNEMRESVSIIRQCLKRMEPGPIEAKMPPVLKAPPASEVYYRIESSRGEMGVYLVGDGTPKPWKAKFRCASFSNLYVLDQLTRGWKVADIMAVLGSLDMIVPEVDR
ncbi:MAG TPA: NADH-quinone oxidoreductase subunit D [bacterium]